MADRDFLLVGHRGTGKTTLAAALAEQGWDVVDLDSEIERTGRSCEDILAQDGEARFRALEQNALAELLSDNHQNPRIIVLGAGCFPIPIDPLCVWVRRTGWEQSATEERQQVWPELTNEQELERMREEREPRYAAAADLVFDLENGSSIAHNAKQLACLINWTASGGDLARNSYLVVPNVASLPRCEARVKRLGLAGLEIRSDVFEAVPSVSAPYIASVRTDDPNWLKGASDAKMWDIDLAFVDAVQATGVFQTAEPRPVILSSHMEHSPDGPEILATARAAFRAIAPDWAERVICKYAPHNVADFAAAASLLNARSKLGPAHILLPQGQRWAWLRPILGLRSNFLNYIGLGMANGERPDALPPWDLRDWLPHLGLTRGSRFDALFGDPAEHSQGDIYHRHAAERVGLNVGYVRVTVSTEELDAALGLARQLGVFNISVTSPLKIHAAEAVINDAPEAVNTLVWRNHGWFGWDTDEAGMRACLQELEAQGIAPGTIAIIGGRGVKPALLRAIQASDWTLAFQARTRQGWTSAPQEVTLIVNASGDRDAAYLGPPKSRAWLDLHYIDIREPENVEVHLNGDTFFVAQAEAQRLLWGYPVQK